MEGVNELIRDSLKDGKQVELQEIYRFILKKGKVSNNNREMIRDLKHQIRSSMWNMLKTNEIIRVSKGVYKKS